MAGYAPVASPRLLDAAAVENLFGKPKGWFARDRVRKALYARGFPLPVIRGRWLRTAIESWLEREGNRREATAPTRNRKRHPVGYADLPS